MAYDMVVDSTKLNTLLKSIADAIREKTGSNILIPDSELAENIENIITYKASIKQMIEKPTAVTEIVLPDDLTRLGEFAFYRNSSVAFSELPETVTYIDNSAIYQCDNVALTKLPAGLTYIGNSALRECPMITIAEIPVGVTSIGSFAFRGCSGLTALTFKGTPDSIITSAFQNCTNLVTIRVPWSEGAVANAPWGATNATIIYNYKGV